MPKLTESSKAVVLPQKKLRNGDISLSDNAKYVWESDPIFIQHKLDNFWTNFNRIKAEEEQAEDDLIEPKFSMEVYTPSKKRKISSTLDERPMMEQEMVAAYSNAPSYQPLYPFSDWVEAGITTRRLTVAIRLPSGVSVGEFSARVSGDGHTSLFSVTWPEPLVNLSHLHRKWLSSKSSDRIETYHPKMIGFEQFLKSCRTRNTDKVESTARIILPFQIQNHIFRKFNVGWAESNASVVYLELQGHEEYYGSVRNDSSFEIC